MTLPRIPIALRRAIGVLPTFPASLAFSLAGNLALWPSLRDLDWQEVYGRRFCVKVNDLGLKFYFSIGRQGFVPEVAHGADVTFSAGAEDFIRLGLRQEDPDTLFFNRRLLIEGDTELGLRVKNMLDGVELDALLRYLPPTLRRV
ncbi:MAG: SCP2 sterol-binding domain-containing protein [Betaproteobacteria bacterium]|nr:SCP2 sterol-binding domain-containing protein [Betaproteobacteria bacterium]